MNEPHPTERLRAENERLLARLHATEGERDRLAAQLAEHRDRSADAVRDKHRAQVELQVSEDSLRARTQALETSASGILITDPHAPDNPIVYVNPGFELMTGYSAAEVMGRNCRFLQWEDLDQPGVAALREALAEGREARAVIRNYKKDGTMFWNEVFVSPVRDEAGKLAHYVGIQNDVTQGRRDAEELRLLNRAVDSSVNAIIITDATRRDNPITYVNAAFERMTGYAAADAIGRNCRFLQGADRDQPALEELRRALAEGRDGRVVLRNYRKDGSMFWNELFISPVRDDEGRVTHFVGIQTDITGRRYAEEALRLRDRAIANAVNGVIITDLSLPDNPIIYVNPGFERMTGYTASEILGKNCRFLQASERDQPAVAEIRQAIKEQRECHAVLRNYRKDGTMFWNELFISPVRDEEGKVTHFVGIQNNITSYKRSEAEIARRARELDALNQRLVEADRYKDEFLSVISHELRTPLNFIAGFASILEDEISGPLTGQQHDNLTQILAGVDRMAGLVNDLLDFARLKANKLDIMTRPTPYEPLIRDVLATLEPLAVPKNILLIADVQVDEPVEMDPQRVIQILTNLVGNAIKFSDGGEVRIHVTYQNDEILTEVVDAGVGIEPRDLAKLFTRFSQLDMSSTRAAGGTGLGLSIAKALVEAQGGRIGVRSPGRGQGSTFWFTLPGRR